MLTALGILLEDVLSGYEVRGVSQSQMERICLDMASMTPPMYVRTGHDSKSGKLKVQMVGTVDPVRRARRGVR